MRPATAFLGLAALTFGCLWCALSYHAPNAADRLYARCSNLENVARDSGEPDDYARMRRVCGDDR